MLKTKVYLCSFASNDLNLSVKRFVKQAKNLEFYDQIKVFRPEDLSNELKERISNLFKKGGRNRYYGFDVWRPEIIKNYLNSIQENSILHYSDVGNHLNKNGLKRLKDYVLMTEKNYMTTFDYGDPPEELKKYNYKFQKYMEYEYTKGDVINYFNASYDSKIFNSPQIWGGTFFIKKSEFSSNFLKQWEDANQHIELLDDSISKHKNHEKFVGMRGCQSIFSILCKINNVKTISASECDWAENQGERKWDQLEYYPILAKRDKQYNVFKRFLNRQKKNLKRVLKKIR